VARRANKELADELKEFILDLPNLKIIEVNFDSALEIVELGKKYGLKGMDAIVTYVASEFASTLASLDKEMVEKSRPEVETYSLR
jgi:predicted nucleic acid-binding protein